MLRQTLEQAGVRAFGLAMPLIAPHWTHGATPTVDDAAMSLDAGEGSWVAPLPGTLRVANGADLGATLVGATGAHAAGPGMLLTLYPQVYLRLRRLYAVVLEDETDARPERAQGLPFRPVPRYFFYRDAITGDLDSGYVGPGESLAIGGELTIYDADGLPIDPLAVAAAFEAFMARHNLLQHRALGDPFVASSQLAEIADLAGTPAVVRLRLADAAGQPYGGEHLEGITALDAGSGLFTLDADGGGGGSDLTGMVSKQHTTEADGVFPPVEHNLLKFGPATTGRLRGENLAFPALPGRVTLACDFFSLRVVTLGSYLRGAPPSGFVGTQLEIAPTVRVHEPLDLLADGNDVLGAANEALDGAAGAQLVVAQAIDADFPVPDAPGDDAHWPQFPAMTGTADDAGALPIDLRDDFAPSAHWFDDGDTATANVDVVLSLSGLPAEAAIRVYNRRFIEDALEARGPGAGGVAAADGTLTLWLPDPLGLRTPGTPDSAITIPNGATLRVDVMVVKRTGEARLYGNISAPVDPASTGGPPSPAGNDFDDAPRRGVSNAGVLGLGGNSGALPSDFVGAAIELAGEGTPRDAPRLPTMARRELLVAGLTADADGDWRGVLAGGRLAPETHSAEPRRGAPGGRGGRETQVVGVSTQNGRLAYDIGRMALRRTDNIVTRLGELADERWNEPDEPDELAADAAPNQDAGTFAGAVLQSIAPYCETPELAVLRSTLESNPSALPGTFDDLVDWVANNLVPAGMPVRTQIINALNGLKDDDTLSESRLERLYNETRRELAAAGWGRRDTLWALQGALQRARRFVYIESPGFTRTARDYGSNPTPDHAVDLVHTLAGRLGAASGLRVIVCTPKHADFAAGYEVPAAHEVKHRYDTLNGLPTAADPNPASSRVAAFHPVGFPGRPSRLESTVVIVDDVWALVGSSTFRRRGLTFDGGTDLVFTDTDLVEGVSPAIAEFRRRLMAARLGIRATDAAAAEITPEPDFVRLRDGAEAFHVVRDRLRAGGLGTIERLWNGRTPGLESVDETGVSFELTSPDGLEFDLLDALALSAVASLNAF